MAYKKEYRPKLNIEPDQIDKGMEWLALLFMALTILLPIIYYTQLPDKIPLHFNFKGTPDSWTTKNFIFFYTAIAIPLFFLVRFLKKKPHQYNYPVKLNESNVETQYKIGIKVMGFVNLSCMLIFAVLTFRTIQVGLGTATGLGITVWAAMIFMMIGIVYYSRQAYISK